MAILHDPGARRARIGNMDRSRSEEHTSELQSQSHLVCRLLLAKKMHPLHSHRHMPILPPPHHSLDSRNCPRVVGGYLLSAEPPATPAHPATSPVDSTLHARDSC